MAQLGILSELDSQAPADYSGTEHGQLNQQVWRCIKQRGVRGATAVEVARQLGHTIKSIAGRITELLNTGHLRRSEARRNGTVYIAIGEWIV
jgi:predicted HTH transcriptional regulator